MNKRVYIDYRIIFNISSQFLLLRLIQLLKDFNYIYFKSVINKDYQDYNFKLDYSDDLVILYYEDYNSSFLINVNNIDSYVSI